MAADAFSESYATARSRFIEAGRQAGLLVESRLHPAKGIEGEELAIDLACEGHPTAEKLLIVTSGCHGVEGFGGSGVQLSALHDDEWREHARRLGVAVLYIHALNPYGFSHLRRVTHENVDLNRNFHDFSKPLPTNDAYRDLHPLLLPPEWPPGPQNAAALGQYIASHGPAAFQSAITRGQHQFADGLFFGGAQPAWSNQALREVLRAHGRRAGHIAWIDIHTGLGPSGVGERIFAGRNDPAAMERARKWWGDAGLTPVTSIYDGSSTSAFLTGMMCEAVYEECPQAQYTGIAMEFGTVPALEALHALRADHWLHLHPRAPASLAAQIRSGMKNAFYTDTAEWKGEVLRQAREALVQAVEGLAA